MRAFGFTNGLRRSSRGADTQRDTGGNKNRSLESWQMAGDGPGTERGPRGPPRDLTLRGGFAGDHGSTMAGEIPAERNTPLAFPSARGQATGPGFEPMTQDTSPEPGALNSGDNPLRVALTGYMPMWAGGRVTRGPRYRKPLNQQEQILVQSGQACPQHRLVMARANRILRPRKVH